MTLSAVFALLWLLVAPAPLQEVGAVYGRVRSESTGEPLAGAVVEVQDGRAVRRALTDAGGAYRLEGIAAGRRTLQARHLGYAALELEVVIPAGREVSLDLALRPVPIALAPVRVHGTAAGSRADTVAAPAVGLAKAGARALESTPGLAELGVAAAARRGPDHEPADPADVLYVRGTGADLKLVYLDGAPVYAPFPLGGLLEAFTPGLLRSADVHLGGAPARYDGGLSYVLDLRTRGPNTTAAHSSGAVDLLSSRVLAEAPLGAAGGVLVAARNVHGRGTRALGQQPLPYGYGEGMLRADLGVATGTLLSATLFRNGEEVWLDGEGSPDQVIGWGNTAASARLRTTLGGTQAEVTAAFGDFAASLPLDGRRPVLAEGASSRTRLSTDFTRLRDGLAIRYGMALDRQRQSYRTRPRGGGAWQPAGEGVTGDAAGAYLDLGYQPHPRLSLRGGLRADHFSFGPSTRLAPRLSATWLAGERVALTLAAGRYHQYLRPPERSQLAGDSARSFRSEPLSIGSASHLALALDQELGGGVRLGVEGFFKSFHDVPGESGSEANASGMDVWVRRAEGDWTGWLGYSLAWVWSLDAREQASRFSGRQLLSTGLTGPLGEQGQLRFALVYGAGLPYSAIPLGLNDAVQVGLNSATTPERVSSSADAAPLLPAPDRPYLRVDLGASRTWTGRLRGAPVQLSPYLRLLNTLGHRDALFYRFDRRRDQEPRALVVLPTVPVLGLEWKF